MLKPQSNPYRQTLTLASFWDFRFDPKDIGKNEGWMNGVSQVVPIAVPASWNDQFADERDNLGPAWYQNRFDLPWGWGSQEIWLRFNSVNYLAEVWLNGVKIGEHEGGHLPFDFNVTGQVRSEGNLLVVRVDGALAPERVPPGAIPAIPGQNFDNQCYPPANFDFYPFCGIQRPVVLYSLPKGGLDDLTVVTDLAGTTGVIRIDITTRSDDKAVKATLRLRGPVCDISTTGFPAAEKQMQLSIPQARLWSPDSPTLYQLVVELERDNVVFDRYTLDIGIRTITVEGDQLLLNGKPVFLKGFGRHEDFPVTGRGWVPAVIIKDYNLMKWVGANSFRTTHYPYSDEMMDLADRLGFLVIDETPAVGLFFDGQGLENRLRVCRQYTRELIARDKNHPSVILWSLANEPHSVEPAAQQFFRPLFDLAKSLDQTRPITLVSSVGPQERAFDFLDVVCLNRYHGWYTEPGQLEKGINQLSNELEEMHALYPKPLILTEFGADAIPGVHAQPMELFSEEYQAETIAQTIRLLNTKPYVVGQHVWNLCDFKTAQAVRRMGGMNYKGVFTRDRRPKLAAHRLKALWDQSEE